MSTFWVIIQQVITTVLTIAGMVAFVAWFGGQFIEAKIKSYFDRALEDYRFELKTREQAAQIAEYAALAWTIKETDSPETYRRANQLSWQLFLWLPADVYRKLGKSLAKGDPKELTQSMVDVRITSKRQRRKSRWK
jgi:hypothetical protein